MNALRNKFHTEMIRSLVSKTMICPITGELLDYRTCSVIVDSDGDPALVYGSDMRELVAENGDYTLPPGYSWMERNSNA